jgi:hypothetical protein
MVSPIEKIIRKHTNAVISGKTITPQGPCPRCFEKPETFKEHDCRDRSFRFIVGNFVQVIFSLLLRWKCPICDKTFTDYPFFALPHKRYTLMDIERLCKDYIENEKQTYLKAASHDGMRIGYQGSDSKDEDRLLEPSTLWRWIGYLGAMKKTINQALHLLTQKASSSSILPQKPPIPQGKYRSAHRKSILQNARTLLRACQEFHCPITRFDFACFPHLATNGCRN